MPPRAISRKSDQRPQRKAPTPAQGAAGYHIDGVVNAARLLKLFSRAAPSLSVEHISRAAGMSADMAARTLETLAHHDFITLSAPGVYSLGFAWLGLADIRRRQVGVRQLATPVMRRIRDRVKETVILVIRSGDRRVNIDYIESMQAIRRTAQPGFEAPLHTGSAGKTLLSGLSMEDLGAYFDEAPLKAFNTGAPLDRAALIAEVAGIRRDGYAVAYREITGDAAAVSAPVFDHRGDIAAALTVSCPADRFTDGLKSACIAEVQDGAAEISRMLGFNPQQDREARELHV